MANIQKCVGNLNQKTCKKLYTCLRFTSPASYMQAWGNPASDFDEFKGCSLFLQDDSKIKTRLKGVEL